MAPRNTEIIVIKKVKKHRETSHGGAWKIAYADFVTAMMAFFLLMWLISIISEETKKGIADYFSSSIMIFEKDSGAEGLMDGQNAKYINESEQTEDATDIAYNIVDSKDNEGKTIDNGNKLIENIKDKQQTKPDKKIVKLYGMNKKATKEEDKIKDAKKSEEEKKAKQKELEKELEKENYKKNQTEKFKEIEKNLKQLFNANKELEMFKNNLIFEFTDQGLRIQIIDSNRNEMFKTGESTPLKHTKTILSALGKAIKELTNKITITGHTDSKPYANQDIYGNWELSADRANAARKALESAGVSNDNFTDIIGKAEKEPFNKEDTEAPENKRVSVTLLYKELK